jgi:hypothetical protein
VCYGVVVLILFGCCGKYSLNLLILAKYLEPIKHLDLILCLCFASSKNCWQKQNGFSTWFSAVKHRIKTVHNVTLILYEYVVLECRLLFGAPQFQRNRIEFQSKQFHSTGKTHDLGIL